MKTFTIVLLVAVAYAQVPYYYKWSPTNPVAPSLQYPGNFPVLFSPYIYYTPVGFQYQYVTGPQMISDDKEEDLLDGQEELNDENSMVDVEMSQAAQTIDNCGKRPGLQSLPRVVNGVETMPNQFPFMVALFNNHRYFCGGSLLDETHVLTAAHCVRHFTEWDFDTMRVFLGDHDLSLRDKKEQHVRVKSIIKHESFQTSTKHNDVAILVLASPVTFTNEIQPICLVEDTSKLFVGETVQVAGWGATSKKGPTSRDLQVADVQVLDNEQCAQSFGQFATGGITSGMLCASSENTSPCYGDGGGPLFKCDNETCYQIGIVSWNFGCSQLEFPGVYTRITEMIPWIRSVMSSSHEQ